MKLDPADHAIISQALVSTAREMGVKLIRSAYSTIVRESNDCSAALLDRDGNSVAQSELMAQQLGSLSATFGPCAALDPVDTLEEGDFYLSNDPYSGGQHLPDIFLFTPIFIDGEVIGFAATVAHHIDIGGGAPGLNMAARELYQEGLILPPARYNVRRDWNGGALERLLRRNIRVPEQTIGDVNAQFAGNEIGAARVQALCRKYGHDIVRASMAELIAYSERRMRAAIAEAPDGVYEGEDVIDSDGDGGQTLPIRVRVTIAGDSVAVDFTGTAAQVRGNMNCPFASTVSAAVTCVKSVLTSADIPYNSGSARPISVVAPFGSILNPKPPAAVRARMTASNRAHNAVMKALAKAAPERAIAIGFDTTTGPYLSHVGPQGYRIYHEVIGGGWGASAGADGCSGVAEPMSNCSNAPVETLDMDFDFFRVIEYSLVPDSGGRGKQRGGLGICRRYEILRDGVAYAQYGDRFLTRPQGLLGGEAGAPASVTLLRDGTLIQMKSKDAGELRRGDILTVRTGGGAGYGRAEQRDADLISRDRAEGDVTS